MSESGPLAIRPSRFICVQGGLVLLLDAIIVATIQFRGILHRPIDAALAAIIVGSIALYGLNAVLVGAVAKTVVDDDTIEVRNRVGHRRRFPRSDFNHAARRSVLAPAQSGIYQDELLLVRKDGRCLIQLWESDYSSADLQRLVEALGQNWPKPERATVRHVEREYPGAHRFDYQTATVAILIVVAVGLAVIAFAVLTR